MKWSKRSRYGKRSRKMRPELRRQRIWKVVRQAWAEMASLPGFVPPNYPPYTGPITTPPRWSADGVLKVV